MTNFEDKFKEYHIILQPDKNEPDWWAGAPTVVRDDDGVFWLAARMREAYSSRGQRGYEIRILRSDDGIHFEQVHSIAREASGTRGFERPALMIDPHTGKFKLYACGTTDGEGYRPWAIFKFDDADDPSQFDASSCRTIIESAYSQKEDWQEGVRDYKDPVLTYVNGVYHMFTIGFDRIERAYHFTSLDGERWMPARKHLAFDISAWHNFYTRPSCILPLDLGFMLIYEGSNCEWFAPCYNIVPGFAWSLDLDTFIDLTPDKPLLKSSTPGDYITWRYSHWLKVEDRLYVYAEVACPNNTYETRLFITDAFNGGGLMKTTAELAGIKSE